MIIKKNMIIYSSFCFLPLRKLVGLPRKRKSIGLIKFKKELFSAFTSALDDLVVQYFEHFKDSLIYLGEREELPVP